MAGTAAGPAQTDVCRDAEGQVGGGGASGAGASVCRIERRIELVVEASGSHSGLSREQTGWSESRLGEGVPKRCGFVSGCREAHGGAVR